MTEDISITLSEDAVRLAKHLVQVSEKGLRGPIGWSSLLERFSASDRGRMAEAAFELEQTFLISIAKGLNAPDGISHVRPDYALYWLLDHDVFDYDTDADIVTLLDLLLADGCSGSAPELQKHMGWPLRRFNPPFARIMAEFPDGRVSRTLQPDYPSMQLIVTAEDRVRLKKLRASLDVEKDISAVDDKSDAPAPDPAASVDERKRQGWISYILSHPNWTGFGGLIALVALVLAVHPPSEWHNKTAVVPAKSDIQAARNALQELAPSKARLTAVLEHFDFGVLPHTSNEQAKAMMLFLHPTTLLPKSRGTGATTGTFGTPDSNGLQYEVTIWKDSYEKTNRYGIRFGLSDSAYWGCNDSYMEIRKESELGPKFVLNPPHFAPCD